MPRTPKGPNKRLLQGARSREEILDVASRMMSARGFEGTSVADIARESGMPNSSIYWHFNSKAGILAAVMERGAERFFSATVLTGPPDAESPLEYLRWALHRSSDAFTAHPEFLRLFILLLLSNEAPETREIVARVREQGWTRLHQLIRNAFLPTGDQNATLVADCLTDYALAFFDGAFLATQANPAVSHLSLMDQLADSLATLGASLLANA